MVARGGRVYVVGLPQSNPFPERSADGVLFGLLQLRPAEVASLVLPADLLTGMSLWGSLALCYHLASRMAYVVWVGRALQQQDLAGGLPGRPGRGRIREVPPHRQHPDEQ